MPTTVLLRPVTEADLPIFFEHQLDPDATRMADFPSRDRETFMAHWAKIMVNPAVVVRTILCDEQVAGNIVNFKMAGEWLVGYWIGKEYWGRGIATQALAQFLKEVQRRPLHARVAKHNLASRRVLEKCGFSVCGEEKNEDGEEFILRLDV